MTDPGAPAWPRARYTATPQRTQIFFVCFSRAPLSQVALSRSRFGLPRPELFDQFDIREHQRSENPAWFEGWWSASFGFIARRELGRDLELLTASQRCVTLSLDAPDQADLAPIQTMWGLVRWLCERGCDVVLDVHAFHFRTRAAVESLTFDGPDLQRDVKLVFETNPTECGLHLMHTRGLCKFARPELLGYIRPDDVQALEPFMLEGARLLMEGATATELRLGASSDVELVTKPNPDATLIENLGLSAAVLLARSDGAPLAGIGRISPHPA
jgi:hypothetical protein